MWALEDCGPNLKRVFSSGLTDCGEKEYRRPSSCALIMSWPRANEQWRDCSGRLHRQRIEQIGISDQVLIGTHFEEEKPWWMLTSSKRGHATILSSFHVICTSRLNAVSANCFKLSSCHPIHCHLVGFYNRTRGQVTCNKPIQMAEIFVYHSFCEMIQLKNHLCSQP